MSGSKATLIRAASDMRSPSRLREAGCICDLGCRSCGMPYENYGACPAFDPCPMGRDPNPNCSVHQARDQWRPAPPQEGKSDE